MFGHEVIPHHHHDEHDRQTHAQGHDHDGEGEHHHNLLDLFFAVLHHVDEDNSLYVHGSLDGRFSDKMTPSFFAVCDIQILSNQIDVVTILKGQNFDPTYFSLAQTSPSLRGPPLA